MSLGVTVVHATGVVCSVVAIVVVGGSVVGMTGTKKKSSFNHSWCRANKLQHTCNVGMEVKYP